jgi:predicted homoserine dehydrogenase-like protein
LCHLEIPRTIRRVRDALIRHESDEVRTRGDAVLLNNGVSPRIGVQAIAKRDLKAGHRIHRGIGSFDLRGVAVRMTRHPDHLPIGLISDAVVARPVERGQPLDFSDVELSESLARAAWERIRRSSCRLPWRPAHSADTTFLRLS